MGCNFGRVKKVNFDGTTVEMQFLESGENRTISVSQLKKELLDTSLVRKMESIRKEFAGLLVMEVDKGATLSVEYLLQYYPDIVDCRSSYNGTNCTALSVACQKGNLEIVKLLLQYKASVKIEDEDGEDEDFEEREEERWDRPIHHVVLG
jgi:ankyrin repeat protein